MRSVSGVKLWKLVAKMGSETTHGSPKADEQFMLQAPQAQRTAAFVLLLLALLAVCSLYSRSFIAF